MTKKNLPLKFALIEKYGSQNAACGPLGLGRDKISRIVCGWDVPTAEQRKRFEKALGKEKMKEIFPAV